jgi:hypothetical protein
MIPVKIECGCGQKYSFDVEPVNGRMESTIACPSCGTDGTGTANEIIARNLATQPAQPAVLQVSGARLAPAPPPIPSAAPARPMAAPARIAPAAAPVVVGEFNLGMGILGAFLGAAIGVGAMYGFFEFAGFRFPLLGVGIGVLTGFGAKLLYKGTDNTLGIISGAIALIAVVGTLFLMYGTFPVISIISVAVSVSMAYRISSG